MINKLPAILSSLAFVVVLAPQAYAVDVEVTDNGANSSTTVNIMETDTTIVDQSNKGYVENSVVVMQNSGENQTSKNNGGDVHVKTGNMMADVVIVNQLNNNVADVNACCEAGDHDHVAVTDNGAKTNTKVNLSSLRLVALKQINYGKVSNSVVSSQNSGGNVANANNGGDVEIETGDMEVEVGISNEVNANMAEIDTCDCDGDVVMVKVADNGYKAKTNVRVKTDNVSMDAQVNHGVVGNGGAIMTNSGTNRSSRNNGGSVSTSTGTSSALFQLFNSLNLNMMSR